MFGWDEFRVDTKSDVHRLCTKVNEYKKKHKDPYGVQFVKDWIRQTYIYKDVDDLNKSFKRFVDGAASDIIVREKGNCYYAILEVKPKLYRSLGNVTLVVATHYGTIGEV